MKPAAWFTHSNQQIRVGDGCAQRRRVQCLENNLNNTVALRLYQVGAMYYKICVDSYEIHLLNRFSLPLRLQGLLKKSQSQPHGVRLWCQS